MIALPHSLDVGLDVAAPQVEVARPAWLDGLVQCGRVAGLCCLVLLVPGEAGRLGSGDLSHHS